MCSNADIDEEESLLMKKIEKINLIGKDCKKCAQNKATVVLQKKDTYCKQCFLASVNHKFRACLGKSKMMRPGDKVLIGYSGSENSIALLHLIQTGLHDISHKKLMFLPSVVYIDEGSALNLTEEDMPVKSKICQILQTYGEYPMYIVPLELSILSEEHVDSYLAKKSSLVDSSALKDIFSTISDVTSRMDMLSKLRHNLLVQVARSLGCNKVFTAETGYDLAIKLISNISVGRGAQLPYDVGFSDDRFQDVKLIRPLRDLSKKELVYYNMFHSLASTHVPSLLTKTDVHTSIQRLTESFLCDLQEGFPSTLSTVFRVADKLTANSGDINVCPLCQAPVDTSDVASSSLSATQFSRLLSTLGPSNVDAVTLMRLHSDSDCCGKSEDKRDETCQSSGLCSSGKTRPEVHVMLCYGCSLIFKDANIKTLPSQFMKKLHESSQRHKMKKEIEDFLL